MGYGSKKIHQLAEKAGVPRDGLPIKQLTSAKLANDLKELVVEMYQKLSEDLLRFYQDYSKKEAKFEKDRMMFGSLTEQKQSELEQAKKMYEKFFSIVSSMSEALDMDMPNLQVNSLQIYIN